MKYHIEPRRIGGQIIDWRVYLGDQCVRVFSLKKYAIAWILKQEATP
jgi:hypothetical protein